MISHPTTKRSYGCTVFVGTHVSSLGPLGTRHVHGIACSLTPSIGTLCPVGRNARVPFRRADTTNPPLCGTEGFVYQAAMALHVSGRANASGPRTHRRGRTLFRSALRGVLSAAVVGAPLLVPAPIVYADPADTTAVDIRDDVRGRLRIRLLGIDTPETKKPGYTVVIWGPEATEFAKSTLLGQRVALIYDQSQGLYDRYGRWPTSTKPTVGTIRLKRHGRVPPTPTSIATSRPPALPRSRRRNKRRRMHSAVFGVRRVTGTPRPFPIRTRRPWCR